MIKKFTSTKKDLYEKDYEIYELIILHKSLSVPEINAFLPDRTLNEIKSSIQKLGLHNLVTKSNVKTNNPLTGFPVFKYKLVEPL